MKFRPVSASALLSLLLAACMTDSPNQDPQEGETRGIAAAKDSVDMYLGSSRFSEMDWLGRISQYLVPGRSLQSDTMLLHLIVDGEKIAEVQRTDSATAIQFAPLCWMSGRLSCAGGVATFRNSGRLDSVLDSNLDKPLRLVLARTILPEGYTYSGQYYGHNMIYVPISRSFERRVVDGLEQQSFSERDAGEPYWSAWGIDQNTRRILALDGPAAGTILREDRDLISAYPLPRSWWSVDFAPDGCSTSGPGATGNGRIAWRDQAEGRLQALLAFGPEGPQVLALQARSLRYSVSLWSDSVDTYDTLWLEGQATDSMRPLTIVAGFDTLRISWLRPGTRAPRSSGFQMHWVKRAGRWSDVQVDVSLDSARTTFLGAPAKVRFVGTRPSGEREIYEGVRILGARDSTRWSSFERIESP